MLAYMAATMNKRPIVKAKSVGAAIRARRAYLGLRAEELAEITGGVINTRFLSRLENDHISPASLRVGKYRALLAGLRWTAAEFEEATGVQPVTTDDELPGSRPYIATLSIPIAGTVSAGIQAVQMDTEFTDFLHLDPSLPGLRNRRESDLVALRVNGDSMVSEHAALSVRPGAHVIVELGAIALHGDMVVAWLPRRDTAVIKLYRESGEVVLRSINPAGPAFRQSDEPLEIRGVVRAIISYP